MMIVELEEMKNYLRIDHDDDDALIGNIIASAEAVCLDVSRCADMETFAQAEKMRRSP
jgi:uncharacterized phage protein (predicted DNA packaging)